MPFLPKLRNPGYQTAFHSIKMYGNNHLSQAIQMILVYKKLMICYYTIWTQDHLCAKLKTYRKTNTSFVFNKGQQNLRKAFWWNLISRHQVVSPSNKVILRIFHLFTHLPSSNKERNPPRPQQIQCTQSIQRRRECVFEECLNQVIVVRHRGPRLNKCFVDAVCHNSCHPRPGLAERLIS